MSSIRRIDDIEVLRAFAVLFVVLHHLNGNLHWFSSDNFFGRIYASFNGGFGVDLFFAISGFVIARSMLPKFSGSLRRKEFKSLAFSFWTRRIFRLLPSAWLWLAIILLLQMTFNESGVFGSLRANIEATIAAVLQFANVRFAMGFGQFELGASFVYWSLSLEEQFYMVFPFLALLTRSKLIIVLAAVICLQLFQARGMWLMMFRTDALCFGILAAMMVDTNVYASLKRLCTAYSGVFSAILALLLFLMVISSSKNVAIQHYDKSVIAILSFPVVLICSFNRNLFGRLLPFHKAFLWIGSRSYAIYLMHIPLFYVVRELFFRLDTPISDHVVVAVALCFLLVACCAELNFRLVEDPVRRWGANLAERKFGAQLKNR